MSSTNNQQQESPIVFDLSDKVLQPTEAEIEKCGIEFTERDCISTKQQLINFVKTTGDHETYSFLIVGGLAEGDAYIKSMRSQWTRFKKQVVARGGTPLVFSFHKENLEVKGRFCEVTLLMVKTKIVRVEDPAILDVFTEKEGKKEEKEEKEENTKVGGSE